MSFAHWSRLTLLLTLGMELSDCTMKSNQVTTIPSQLRNQMDKRKQGAFISRANYRYIARDWFVDWLNLSTSEYDDTSEYYPTKEAAPDPTWLAVPKHFSWVVSKTGEKIIFPGLSVSD